MRSRRGNAAPLPPSSAVAASLDALNGPVVLSPFQQETLLAARAWWFEGERALDYLAEQSRRAVLFERLRPLLDEFRAAPAAQTVRPVLLLARQLSANRALNRTLYSDDFARTLHSLLYGTGPLFDRLHGFLQTVHVGPQTASHLLFAAFPDRYPLVSQQTRSVIAPTPAQVTQARTLAAMTYGVRDAPAKNEEAAKVREAAFADARALLADFLLYEAVRDMVQADTFDTVHGILWHSREMPPPPQNGALAAPKSSRKSSGLSAGVVREPLQNHYAAQGSGPVSAEGGETADAVAASENDLLLALEREIAEAGFTFAPLVVRRYYVSLKAKPFVILSGLSGTGKTRLTSLFARALCGPSASERDQYLLVPVRPDWTSSDALLGYHNLLTDRYVSTPFLQTLQKAALPENRDRAFFVCLDEMNLARVEHYFSDLLSAMETEGGRISLHENQSVVLPPNVFLTGSVNMDEATHPFSRKVLDRANTIEFASVSFADAVPPLPPAADAPGIPSHVRQKLFLSRRVGSVRAARERVNAWDTALAGRVVQTLTDLNALLAPRQMHFGYRVRDEVLRYVAASFDRNGSGLFTPDDAGRNEILAVDTQILQKVLPRIAGTHETLHRLLFDVREWAQVRGFVETARKLSVMQTRGEETGMVSFYEP